MACPPGVDTAVALARDYPGTIRAIIVGNEVLDAMPVHLMIKNPPGWQELQVTVSEGRFQYLETPASAELLEQVEQFGNLRPPELRSVNLHDALDRARKSALVGFAANMTIVEGDTGVLVIDPLISTETASAALELYRGRCQRAITFFPALAVRSARSQSTWGDPTAQPPGTSARLPGSEIATGYCRTLVIAPTCTNWSCPGTKTSAPSRRSRRS